MSNSFLEKLKNKNLRKGKKKITRFKISKKTKGLQKGIQNLAQSKMRSLSPKVKRKAGRPKGTTKYKGGVYKHRERVRRKKTIARLNQEETDFQNSFQPTNILHGGQQQPRERFTKDRGGYAATLPDRGNLMAGETYSMLGGTSHILSGRPLEGGAMKSPVQHVDTIHKPVVNPEGDYYTDVDPISGKPILQRRVRERWASEDI